MRKRFQLFVRPPERAEAPPAARPDPVSPRWRSGIALVGCLGLVMVIALMAWLDRLSVLREARQNALALTYSLAEQADSVFVATELALFQLEQAVGQRDVSSLRKDGDVRRLVGELMRRLPHLESLMLVDATGHVAAASGGFPTAADYVGDHEFFHRARAGHDGLHFSVPVGRSDLRATAFTASRPLQGGTGFPGAVAVTIHPEYFRALYRGTLISTSTVAAALIRPDGAVIVASAHMPNTPDQIFPASPARDGGLVRLAMADGTPGIAAFRTLPVARLTLVYLVSEVDVLAPWYARLTGYGLAAVLAGGAMLMLARSGEMIRPRPTWSTGAARDDRSGFVTEVVPSRISRGVDAFLTSALNALALARSRLPADAPQMSAHMSAPAAVRGGEEASAAQALEGAVYGLSAAQRLMGTGRMRDAPQRIVDIRSALPGLQSLMLGSVWPPLQIRFEPAGAQGNALEVFADPARLDLAFLDLVLGLREIAPAGTQMTLSAERRIVRDTAADRLPPGAYVCVEMHLASASGPVREATIRSETRLRHVEIFASQCHGALALEVPAEEAPGGPLRATLWLPAALTPRPVS